MEGEMSMSEAPRAGRLESELTLDTSYSPIFGRSIGTGSARLRWTASIVAVTGALFTQPALAQSHRSCSQSGGWV